MINVRTILVLFLMIVFPSVTYSLNSFRCTADDFRKSLGESGGQCIEYVRDETDIPWAVCNGSAYTCADSLESAGYAIGGTPAVSSVVIFDRAANTDPDHGHLGIVKEVNGDNIVVRDSNWVESEIIGEHTFNVNNYNILGYAYCDTECGDSTEPYSDDISNPYSITSSGDFVNAKICYPSDIDWYHIAHGSGGFITLTLESPIGAPYGMELYDSNENLRASLPPQSGPSEIQINVDSGDYYVKIFGFYGSYDPDSTYRITAYYSAQCTAPSYAVLENYGSVRLASPCAPLSPTNISATDGAHPDKVRISWDELFGATSYRVYRCTDSSINSCTTYSTDSSSPYDDVGGLAGATYYYRVRACNNDGCSDYSEADSGYRQNPTSDLPTINLSATPSSISAGDPTTITWSTQDATSCAASGAWGGYKNINGGSEVSYPGGTTTYALTCSGPGGTATENVTVTVTGSGEPPMVLIDSSETVVNSGDPVYLAWASSYSNTCEASGGWSGTQSLSGTHLVHPSSTTAYTITCYGPLGSDSDSVTITVVGAEVPVILEASPSVIYDGESSTLSWSTTGMSSCDATGNWSGSKPLSGSQTVSPNSNKTYTLTCEKSGGSVTELIQNGEFSGSTNEWSKTGDFYANSYYETYHNDPGYAYLSASDGALINSNSLVGLLYQNVTLPSNASSITLEYWVSIDTLESGSNAYDYLFSTVKDSSGSNILDTIEIFSNMDSGSYRKITFDLTSYSGQAIRLHFLGTTDSSYGTVFRIDDVSIEAIVPSTYSDSATVTVIEPPSPTLSFDADPDTIDVGNESILTWATTNVDDCNASGANDWNGSRAPNGMQNVSPNENTTYTLTCSGNGGSATRHETVNIIQPAPTISISAFPSTIDSGASSTLTWSTTNASSCTALGVWSNESTKPTNGSQVVSPETTAVYGLWCSGTGGSDEASTTIIVNPPPLAPEIDVQGNGISIPNGDNSPTSGDHTYFGNVDTASGSLVRTFYIYNTGTQSLSLTGSPLVSIIGAHSSDFLVTLVPSSSILAGGLAAFQVTFDASTDGDKYAELSILNSDSDENPYNFSIQGTGYTDQPNSTGTIEVSSTNLGIDETGGSIDVSVIRADGSDGAASVSFSTSNGTAVAGSDYTANSGTLAWADGESGVKIVTVSIANDAIAEGNETFDINLSNATGASLGSPASTQVTIFDDEPNSTGTIEVSSTNLGIDETGGSIDVSVIRADGSDGAASVSFSTSNGTAVAGSDYTANSGTLAWADGESGVKIVTVSIANDAIAEGNETFDINLSNATGASLGSPASTQVTIFDGYQPVISCSGTDVDLRGYYFSSGVFDCIASSSLSGGPTTILDGAKVLFDSPEIILSQDFKVQEGAVLSIQTPVIENTFFDDFNRADGKVENGWWSIGAGCSGPIAQIRDKKLASVANEELGFCYGYQANVLRSINFDDFFKFSATLNAERTKFVIGLDPDSLNDYWSGLSLLIIRDINSSGRSGVLLYQDGINIGWTYSPFIFGTTHSVSATIDASESKVFGTVSSDSKIYNFSFNVNLQSSLKNNFAVLLSGPPSTMDNLFIEMD